MSEVNGKRSVYHAVDVGDALDPQGAHKRASVRRAGRELEGDKPTRRGVIALPKMTSSTRPRPMCLTAGFNWARVSGPSCGRRNRRLLLRCGVREHPATVAKQGVPFCGGC